MCRDVEVGSTSTNRFRFRCRLVRSATDGGGRRQLPVRTRRAFRRLVTSRRRRRQLRRLRQQSHRTAAKIIDILRYQIYGEINENKNVKMLVLDFVSYQSSVATSEKMSSTVWNT